MEIRDISQCDKSLDFSPLVSWPERIPGYGWFFENKFFLLSGFNKKDGNIFELRGELAELLKDLYPNLTLPELARLQMVCDAHFKHLVDLSGLAGYRLPKDWPTIAKKLTQTPRQFQDWLSQKNVSLRDVVFLKLTDVKVAEPFLDAIIGSQASKSLGLSNLETACELLARGQNLERLLLHSKSPEKWSQDLFRLRNPVTSQKDQAQEAEIKRLPWPAHTQVRWVRQGDQAGVEIRFHIFSEKDLDRQIQGLDVVRKSMTESACKLN